MNLDALAIALQVNTPVLLQGPPGVGKSASIAQLCRDTFGWHCEIVITSFRDPSDFAGLPIITSDARGVRMAAPLWVYRLIEAKIGVVVFDEINWAPPASQSALFRTIQEGWVGDEPLPSDVRRVAIMNPVGEGGGWDLQAPLANRFVHLTWRNDPMAWIEGMRDGWATPHVPRVPETWRTLLPKWTAIVSAFIKHRPLLLHQFPKDTAAQGWAWPSHRSWAEMGIPLLAACDAIGSAGAARVELLEGSVGPGAATEYFVWERQHDFPDLEYLLAHPETFVLPKRPDIAYAVLSAVAAVAVSQPTLDPVKMTYLERWYAAWKIISLAADKGAGEIAASAALTLGKPAHWPQGIAGHLPPEIRKAIDRFQPLIAASRVVAR